MRQGIPACSQHVTHRPTARSPLETPYERELLARLSTDIATGPWSRQNRVRAVGAGHGSSVTEGDNSESRIHAGRALLALHACIISIGSKLRPCRSPYIYRPSGGKAPIRKSLLLQANSGCVALGRSMSLEGRSRAVTVPNSASWSDNQPVPNPMSRMRMFGRAPDRTASSTYSSPGLSFPGLISPERSFRPNRSRIGPGHPSVVASWDFCLEVVCAWGILLFSVRRT